MEPYNDCVTMDVDSTDTVLFNGTQPLPIPRLARSAPLEEDQEGDEQSRTPPLHCRLERVGGSGSLPLPLRFGDELPRPAQRALSNLEQHPSSRWEQSMPAVERDSDDNDSPLSPYKPPPSSGMQRMCLPKEVERTRLTRSASMDNLFGARPRPIPFACGEVPDSSLEARKQSSLRPVERQCVVPTVVGSHADLNCISPDTMADLVRNVYAKFFKLLVIDCRFPYEYTNGHIMNAINITGSYADDLLQKVFSQNLAACEQTAIVFHCEFSQNRGPDTLRKFRQMDRNYNKENYPRLSYTNVYLLQGGYKEFFPRYKNLCNPPFYTPMDAPEYAQELKQCSAELKLSKKQNSRGGKLRKTQSMYLGEITQTAVCQLVQSSTFLNTFPPGSPRSEATAIEDFRRQATTLWSDTNPSLPVMFGSFKRD